MPTPAKNGIPKKLEISGLAWPVHVRTNLTYRKQRCDGLCKPKEQEILLNRDIVGKHDRARKNLLHELLHALFYDHISYYENEELILLLEERLNEFIRLNPHYFELYGYHRSPENTETY